MKMNESSLMCQQRDPGPAVTWPGPKWVEIGNPLPQ